MWIRARSATWRRNTDDNRDLAGVISRAAVFRGAKDSGASRVDSPRQIPRPAGKSAGLRHDAASAEFNLDAQANRLTNSAPR